MFFSNFGVMSFNKIEYLQTNISITIRYIFHSRIFIFLVLLLHSLLVEIAEIEIVRVIFLSEQCFVYTFLQVTYFYKTTS